MGASALHGKYFLNMTRFPPVFTYNLSIHFNEVFSRVHMVEGNPSYLIFYLYMHDEHWPPKRSDKAAAATTSPAIRRSVNATYAAVDTPTIIEVKGNKEILHDHKMLRPRGRHFKKLATHQRFTTDFCMWFLMIELYFLFGRSLELLGILKLWYWLIIDCSWCLWCCNFQFISSNNS